MADTKIPYRKLPGDYRGFFRRHTLWLAPDHLLQVDSTRFSETYKRFYLTDIQAIVIRKSPRFVLPYYWILLIAAVIVGLTVTAVRARPYSTWAGGVLLIVLAGIAVYLYLAAVLQSCTCHLVTRVNKVELSSLFRLSAAHRFVDILLPRLQSVQGNLPEGWVERALELPESLTAADRNPDNIVSESIAGSFSWYTVCVFVCVLLDAALTWIVLLHPDTHSTSGFNIVNMIALAVCATISLVQLTRSKAGGVLRGLILAALLTVAAANYGSILIQSFDEQFYHHAFPKLLDYPGMRALGVVEIILDAAVAIAGMVLAFRRPEAPHRPTSLFDTGAPPT